MLRRYSKVFPFVELDATYHIMHRAETAATWAAQVPAGFRFSPKVHRAISHDHKLQGVDDLVKRFLEPVEALRAAGKLGPVFLGLPGSMRHGEQAELDLAAFIAQVRPRYDLAVEFRSASWFRPSVQEILQRNGVAATWTVVENVGNPLWRTAPFVYARFIGDYGLDEKHHGQLLRDRSGDFRELATPVQSAAADGCDVYVCMTNHHGGSAPLSLVRLAKEWGLPELDFAAARGGADDAAGRQTRLF